MFKELSYFEKLKSELIQTKSVVHTRFFNQKRTFGTVVIWKEIVL